jgi:tetratricopeptide (TPR) repeat protein
VLAFHYARAGKSDIAVKWLTRAGDQAFANFANREAARFYKEALDLSKDSITAIVLSKDTSYQVTLPAHLNLRLGQAEINERFYSSGAKALQQGVFLLGLPMPRSPFLAGLAAIGQLALQLLHRMSPGYFIGSRKKDKKRLLHAAAAYEALGEACYFSQKPIQCFYSVIRSLNLAEAAGPSPELARGYATLGTAMGLTPLKGVAARYLDRAFFVANEISDPSTSAWIRVVYGIYMAGLGQWKPAEDAFKEVIALSAQVGDRRRRLDGESNLGYLAFLQGELGSASDWARHILEKGTVSTYCTGEESARRVLIYCNTAMGKISSARAHLEIFQDLIAHGHRGDESVCKVDFYSFSAIFLALEGQVEKALEAVDQALCILLKDTSAIGAYDAVTGCEAVAEALSMLWEQSPELPEIAKKARKACAIAAKLAKTYPIGVPKALLLKGKCLWLQGCQKRAMRIWQRSLESAVELKMPLHAALAELEIVCHRPPSATGRTADLDRLHNTFKEMGAHLYAKRALQEMLV